MTETLEPVTDEVDQRELRDTLRIELESLLARHPRHVRALPSVA